MFNVFFHDQISKRVQEVEQSKIKHEKSISAQIKFRDQLVTNNKKRVRQRVMEMSLDPVPMNRHEISTKLPEFKGESFIRHRPKDAKQRIRDAEVSNTWLDTVPLLLPPHNFRPRLKSKEINLDMKYTPRDRYERVTDTWQSQRQFLNNSWEVKPADSSGSLMGKNFPNTLRRSYYKTIESIALNMTTPFRKGAISPQTNNIRTDLSMVDAEDQQKNEKKLVDIAKEVMEKCKLRPLKEEMRSVYTSRSSKNQGEPKLLVKKIATNW